MLSLGDNISLNKENSDALHSQHKYSQVNDSPRTPGVVVDDDAGTASSLETSGLNSNADAQPVSPDVVNDAGTSASSITYDSDSSGQWVTESRSGNDHLRSSWLKGGSDFHNTEIDGIDFGSALLGSGNIIKKMIEGTIQNIYERLSWVFEGVDPVKADSQALHLLDQERYLVSAM